MLRVMAAARVGAPPAIMRDCAFVESHRLEGSPSQRTEDDLHSFAGMKLIALSARAVMVSDGFTPGFALTELPSTMNKPG
jgi:hypothetical protein